MRAKVVCQYIELIVWMLLIFWFSHQPAIESSQMSDGLVITFIDTIEKVTGISLPYDQILSLVVFPIRKLAHFSLYFILGLLWMSLLKEYSLSLIFQMKYAILFCLIYACSDEFHQLFVYGRSGCIFDVGIDMAGSLASIIPIYLVRCHKMKTV